MTDERRRRTIWRKWRKGGRTYEVEDDEGGDEIDKEENQTWKRRKNVRRNMWLLNEKSLDI